MHLGTVGAARSAAANAKQTISRITFIMSSASDSCQVSGRRTLDHFLRATRYCPSTKGTVQPVELQRLERRGDALNRGGTKRNVIRVAVHERDPAAVGTH